MKDIESYIGVLIDIIWREGKRNGLSDSEITREIEEVLKQKTNNGENKSQQETIVRIPQAVYAPPVPKYTTVVSSMQALYAPPTVELREMFNDEQSENGNNPKGYK